MEVNGYPVTVFFQNVLKKWDDKENFKKNQLFAEFLAKEIFACYDVNRGEGFEFYKSEFLIYIRNNTQCDYFEPPKPSLIESKFNKNTVKVKLYEFFTDMKKKNDARKLVHGHNFA